MNRQHICRAFLASALLTTACTNDVTPTDYAVLVRIVVDGQGTVESIDAELVEPDRYTHAEPTAHGELTLEVMNGDDVTWSGHRYVPYFDLSEEFSPAGIVGDAVPVESTPHYLVFPDDGRERIPLRVSLVGPAGGPALVTDHMIELPRGDTDSEGSGLVIVNDDIAGKREALCLGFINTCNEPEEFCSGSVCREEACVPDDTWDNSEVEVAAGSDLNVLLMPLGWADPDAFETYATEVVDALHSQNDWYSENGGRIRFTVWRANCEYGATAPNSDDRSAVLDWARGLEPWTVQLPDTDRIVVIGAGGSCSGVTNQMGRYISLTQCADTSTMADVLAHELGHSAAGLLDEYSYGADLVDCSGDGVWSFNSPNLAPEDDPSWYCNSEAGEVYAGQGCGGLTGGVVGAFVDLASNCSNNIARPCENSIMRGHVGNQFDPVGYAAMTYVLDSGGDMMGYEDCDAGCSQSCTAYDMGGCGLNECNQICTNGCATGESCRGAQEIGYTCREACDPMMGAACMSNLGFEFCHGTTGLTTDGACMGYRISMCENGRVVPGRCVI